MNVGLHARAQVMPMPVIKITTKKDGRQVAWFRDAAGNRVGTTPGANWLKAAHMRELGEYAMQLQLEQAAAGLGSDGQPMPPLHSYGPTRGRFVRRGYPQQKLNFGGRPIRDLRGPGIGGHMLDQIRINFLDDHKVSYSITTVQGRIKAKANQQRAPWWGLSPANIERLAKRTRAVYSRVVLQNGIVPNASSGIGQGGRFPRRVAA